MNNLKPYKSHIPYTKHQITNEDIKSVEKILKSNFLTTGPQNNIFEENFSRFIGTKYAATCANGTAALHLLAMNVKLKSNSKSNFITSPLTFVADANCARYVGASLKFADIDPDTWNMSIDSTIKLIDKNTVAIVITHYAGLPADIHKLKKICKENDIFLIEDACHAPGAKLNNKVVGSFGDASIYSLHPAKHIAAGEGGVICSNSKSLIEEVKVLRNHGLDSWQKRKGLIYDISKMGFNLRMSDIEAGLANSQLKRIEQSLDKRQKIADRYYKNLDTNFIEMQHIDKKRTHAYHLFPILIRKPHTREGFINHMRELNIGVTIHYPLINEMSAFKKFPGKTPIAKDIGSRIVSIPMYPNLSVKEQEFVIEAVNGYFK